MAGFGFQSTTCFSRNYPAVGLITINFLWVEKTLPGPEADQDFMDLQDYAILRALFNKKECEIMTMKLSTSSGESWCREEPWSSHLSRPTLCNPMDTNLLGSSDGRILQARILEWVAISSSRGSCQPRDGTRVFCIGRWILYHCNTWKERSFVVVQLLSCVWLFVTPRTAACQSSTSLTISWSLPKFMSIELVMLSNHSSSERHQ